MSKTYTTIAGDMWDMIAYKVYKNETYIAQLIKANEQYKTIAVFPAGMKLTCPDIDTVNTGLLPPWRR